MKPVGEWKGRGRYRGTLVPIGRAGYRVGRRAFPPKAHGVQAAEGSLLRVGSR